MLGLYIILSQPNGAIDPVKLGKKVDPIKSARSSVHCRGANCLGVFLISQLRFQAQRDVDATWEFQRSGM